MTRRAGKELRDRRVQRTRRMLREALVSLLMERGWDEISVQDVCARADIGRSTFYTHFADKEELLVGGFEDLKKALRAQVGHPGGTGEPLGFARGLIEHADENRRLFQALVGKRTGHVVMRQFRELVLELVREDLAGVGPGGPTREAAVHFAAGAFLELLTWWLDGRASLAVADLDRFYRRMAAPVLRLTAR